MNFYYFFELSVEAGESRSLMIILTHKNVEDEVAKHERVSTWLIVFGTLLGGLGGIAATVAVVRDFDSPIAQAILDDRRQLDSNSRATRRAFEQERQQDNASWEAALRADSPEAYAAYISTRPNGQHVQDALARRASRLEQRAWLAALNTDTLEGYDLYLASYANGPNATAAETNKERLVAAGTGPYALASVAGRARVTVERARAAAIFGEEAQRRARAGEAGFGSAIRRQSLGLRRYRGDFEGRTIDMSNGFTEITIPLQGVWEFGGVNGVESFKGEIRSDSWMDTRYAVIGEIQYGDGKRYEGQSTMSGFQPGSFTRNGYGALWDADGQLIASGEWSDNQITVP